MSISTRQDSHSEFIFATSQQYALETRQTHTCGYCAHSRSISVNALHTVTFKRTLMSDDTHIDLASKIQDGCAR